MKNENLNIVDRILKILKLLHEEFEEKVVQMIDNLIRENYNLTIMNFNRTIRMKILKDFHICIFYCTCIHLKIVI